MGMSVRGPSETCVGNFFISSTVSISRSITPKALRGAGQSIQSDGMPARASELRRVCSIFSLVSALSSSPSVHSQSMCSVVSYLPRVQCGQVLESSSPLMVFIPAEFSLTCVLIAPVIMTSSLLQLIMSSCSSK